MSTSLGPEGAPFVAPPFAAAVPSVPLVVLDGVFARDAAGPRGGARGALSGATASLGPGVHAFLGAPEDGTIALVDVLAGVRRPLRGAALLAGEDPSTSPAARGRTGALLAAPDLPEARTVLAAVELALIALGRAPAGAAAVLEVLGIGPLAARSTAALSHAEARAVELALALEVVRRASPGVLVLFEPCADIAVPSAARAIDEQIAAARAAGAAVVLATSSPADARRLADEIHVLHRGVVVGHQRSSAGALAPGLTEISVTVAAAPGASVRALAAALAEHPSVHAALWEEPPPDTGRRPVLRIRCSDRDACALAVIDAAVNAGVALEALTSSVPDLPAVQSAALSAVQQALARRPPAAASRTAGPQGAGGSGGGVGPTGGVGSPGGVDPGGGVASAGAVGPGDGAGPIGSAGVAGSSEPGGAFGPTGMEAAVPAAATHAASPPGEGRWPAEVAPHEPGSMPDHGPRGGDP